MFQLVYEGELRTKTIHSETGLELETDAPKDNHGKGEMFSPTDLLAVSLASCAMTLMGIASKKRSVDLKGARMHVSKTMLSNPRRIGKIEINFFSSAMVSDDDRLFLEKAALECPVHHSLHPDLIQEFNFVWGDDT